MIAGGRGKSMTERRTPLFDHHVAGGARMVDFAGWDMPLQYEGIVAEHRRVREDCGCFDLGHMGRLRLSGPGALGFLDRRVTRPLASMALGQVRYGLVCAEDGTVEDDVLVSRERDDGFHVVVNASNREKLLGLWEPHLPDDAVLEDLTGSQAMIAVQGPRSAAVLAAVGLDPGDLRIYRFADHVWRDAPVRLSRTGYTGEDGCELFCPADRVGELWEAVRSAGAVPCGLGARDSLRLEAAMPLYGHELDREHTPVEAGLTFAVGKRGGFVGDEVLLRQLAEGPSRRLVGLRVDGPRPARHGYAVLHDGETVGAVTSGGPSPTLGHPIAMAYVPAALAEPGTRLRIDIRGRATADAEVVPLPFYKRER